MLSCAIYNMSFCEFCIETNYEMFCRQGVLLNQIVAIKDQFKSDASYIAYIHR